MKLNRTQEQAWDKGNETQLTPQEQHWITKRQIHRLTDQREVQIYPMGAERYLAARLNCLKPHQQRYPLHQDITGKRVLVLPGHGTSGFLFAQAKARSVTVYDKDPVTIAWAKAFKKYYYYQEVGAKGRVYPAVGALLQALTCWYPPLLRLPQSAWLGPVQWLFHPNGLRRVYLHYLLALVRKAVEEEAVGFEFEQAIAFCVGTVKDALKLQNTAEAFDTAFVPYLLGIRQGIELADEVVDFLEDMRQLVPNGSILVTPSCGRREFYVVGKRYFSTTGYSALHAIPQIPSHKAHDPGWFGAQGLMSF